MIVRFVSCAGVGAGILISLLSLMRPPSFASAAASTAPASSQAAVPTVSPAPGAAPPEIRTATMDDGGEVRFDGVFYDFRDATGLRAMKLWVPPGPGPVRAVLFHGNPGGTGDTRDHTHDRNLLEFAARHGMGVAGVCTFPSGHVRAECAATFLRVFEAWAKLGPHPELGHVPLVARGNSNAGMTALALLECAPERLVCCLPNVAARYPGLFDEAARGVPTLMHIGPHDPFFPLGLKDSAELFVAQRPRGALWAWTAEENKKHEVGHIDGIDFAFMAACLAGRLPEEMPPAGERVALRPIDPATGWLADTATWRQGRSGGATAIQPAAQATNIGPTSVWLPDEGCAILYRAVSSYGNPLRLSLKGIQPIHNPNESGVFLKTVGPPLVDPGQTIVIQCDSGSWDDWTQLAFYEGAELIGQVEPGAPTECAVTVDGSKTALSFSAAATTADGAVRVSFPVSVLVRDPRVSRAIDQQFAMLEVARDQAELEWGAESHGSKPGTDPAADGMDAVLVAVALSPELENAGRSAGGTQPAPFWAKWSPERDRADIAALRHRSGAPEMSEDDVPWASVRAAYSRAGLYLLFTWTSNAWAIGGVEKVVADFHIARSDAAALWSGAPRDRFLSPALALALDGAQFQAATGPDGTLVGPVARNVPFPWHMARREDSASDVEAETGIRVRGVSWGPGVHGQEWFIPWRFVGKPGPWEQPPPGTRLGLALGCDAVRGEARDALRWPAGSDPWLHRSEQGPGDNNPWGDLVLSHAVLR